MGMNWESANKRQLVRERGSEDYRATPGMGGKKKKKPENKKFKNIRSLFDSKCVVCDGQIKKGEMIKYFYDKKIATHSKCKLKTKDSK